MSFKMQDFNKVYQIQTQKYSQNHSVLKNGKKSDFEKMKKRKWKIGQKSEYKSEKSGKSLNLK